MEESKETYWKLRNLSEKIWIEAGAEFALEYSEEISKAKCLNQQLIERVKDIVYKVTYVSRPGQSVDYDNYEDHFTMEVLDEESIEPLSLYLAPYPPARFYELAGFFCSCIIPDCSAPEGAIPAGSFIFCSKHKHMTPSKNLIKSYLITNLQNQIKKFEEKLMAAIIKPDPLIEIHPKVYLDLQTCEVITRKDYELATYGQYYEED